ncbi:MAG: arylesterase [Methylococcaceae bacterium]|nr:arylesterase [Methylococcaceae bacterium]
MAKFLWVVIMALMSQTLLAKSIVVLGDSISAGYGIEVSQGWVALVQKKLGDTQHDFTLHNASITGDTSSGGLARIDQLLIQHKPSVLILELGANDGLRGLPPALMKSNLAEIIRRAQHSNAKVLLLGMKIPPNYGKRYIEMFYNVYPQLAKEMNIPVIPFLLEDVALTSGMMQSDGLHPNVQAQPLIAEKIWQQLLPLLN